MAQVLIVEGNQVYVVKDVEQSMTEAFKRNRLYDTHKNDRFSKDIRRTLLKEEVEKLKKDLYLVDEGV